MTPIENLKAYVEKMKNDPEFLEQEQEKFRKFMEKYDRPKHRIKSIIDPMTNDKFLEFMKKLSIWEIKNKSNQRNSSLLSAIISVADEDGIELDIGNEAFLEYRYQYKGFVFETYVGQGTFHRIYHKELKDIYLQTN